MPLSKLRTFQNSEWLWFPFLMRLFDCVFIGFALFVKQRYFERLVISDTGSVCNMELIDWTGCCFICVNRRSFVRPIFLSFAFRNRPLRCKLRCRVWTNVIWVNRLDFSHASWVKMTSSNLGEGLHHCDHAENTLFVIPEHNGNGSFNKVDKSQWVFAWKLLVAVCIDVMDSPTCFVVSNQFVNTNIGTFNQRWFNIDSVQRANKSLFLYRIKGVDSFHCDIKPS